MAESNNKFKKGINQGNNFGKYEYFKNKGEDFENK